MLRSLTSLFLMFALALPAGAGPVSLDRLSAYFNALGTAQTRFTQYNADGTASQGTLYIWRPGRMRFEYDPPQEALVLAGSGVVAIFDKLSNAEVQQFPLGRTPLSLILAKDINLETANMVFGHREDADGMTVVAARDPKRPETGQIELFFSAAPVALKKWVITDEAGYRTTVVLEDLAQGMEFPRTFFSVEREKSRRGG